MLNRATNPVRTPHLSGFSQNTATSIEGCYTGSFPTVPHRTDLATGRVGWPHYPWQPIKKSSSNHIASLLTEQGYATQLICDCPHLFAAGFNSDFDAAYHTRGQEGDKPFLHLNDPLEIVMPDAKTRTDHFYRKATLANQHRWTNRYNRLESEMYSAQTSAHTVRWLEENYQFSPFFLWVDFFDPHEPWDPPEYLVRKNDPDYKGTPMIHPNYGHSTDYTEEELHNLWAHYAAEAELVDRHIGRVLTKIDDLNLLENSIVVFTSDHGMSLGEHERTGKCNINDTDQRYWPLYPELSHVPFLVAGPGIPKGKSLNLLLQAEDILPTISDLAGVTISPVETIEGNSAASVIQNPQAGAADTFRQLAVAGSFVN